MEKAFRAVVSYDVHDIDRLSPEAERFPETAVWSIDVDVVQVDGRFYEQIDLSVPDFVAQKMLILQSVD